MTLNVNNYTNHYKSVFGPSFTTVQAVYDHIGPHHGNNPFLLGSPECLEFQSLVDAYNLQRLQEHLGSAKELQVSRRPSKRRMPQPLFKPTYETLHDIRMRLERCLLFIGSELYYVREIMADTATKDFVLSLLDKDGKKFFVRYNRCTDIDLRTPEPQYVTVQREPLYFIRPPYRQQRQGLAPENFGCRKVGSGDSQLIRLHELTLLMQGLSTDILPFSTNYNELIDRGVLPSLRLSKDVALYREKSSTKAEYRGRFLGVVSGNEIHLDSDDFQKPWIRRAVEAVACVPKAR